MTKKSILSNFAILALTLAVTLLCTSEAWAGARTACSGRQGCFFVCWDCGCEGDPVCAKWPPNDPGYTLNPNNIFKLTACGGLDEPACIAIPPCDAGLDPVLQSNLGLYCTPCGGNNQPLCADLSCDPGYTLDLLGDLLCTPCGDNDQPFCASSLSCNSYHTLDLFGDGLCTPCGDNNQSPCVPSNPQTCKSGYEYFINNVCELCGGSYGPACTPGPACADYHDTVTDYVDIFGTGILDTLDFLDIVPDICLPCGDGRATSLTEWVACIDSWYGGYCKPRNNNISGFCIKCGGPGEMACMGANEEPCDQGYRFMGDGVANTGIGTCVYNGYIDEPTTNSTITEVPDQNDRETLWGWADVHEHQFANLAYGGLVNWGSVFDERGVNAALAKCDFTHDLEVNTPEIQALATFAVDQIIPQGFVSDAVDNEILPVLDWIDDNLDPLGLLDEIDFNLALGIYDDFYDISLANYIYALTEGLSGFHVPHDILGRGAPVHGDPYVTQWLMGLTNNVSTNKLFEGFGLVGDLFGHYKTERGIAEILLGPGFIAEHSYILTNDYYRENFFDLTTLGSPNYDPGPQHQVDGIPSFNGWPHFLDGGHQQMYYKWLERAYEGGMRLLVNLAVNNKVLCNLSFTRDKHKFSRDPDGNEIDYSCEDMSTADDQIEAMKALEKFIDDENNGDGWYRVAESAAHAREIIRDGDMAVIIGLEVDTLFGCLPDSEEKCTKEYIEQQVEDYYEKGVRYLFSIHGFDNIFAGPALYNDIFVYANLVVNHDRVDFWDCSAEPFNYTYKLVNDEGHGLGPLGWFYETLNDYYSLPTIPDYDAHCNRRGLTEIGEVLVKAMMKNHMIFDIDHLSEITMHGLKGKKFTRLAQTHKLLSDYDLTDSIRKYVKDRDGLTIPVDGVTITQDDINEFFQEFANPELPSDEGISEAGLAAYPLSTLIKKYKINEDEDDLVLKIKTEIYEKYGVVDSEIIAIKEAIILRDGLTIPVEEVEITEDDIYEFVGITNVAIEEIVHLTENDINAFIQEYDLPDPVETEVTDIEIEEFLAHYGLADLMDQFPKGVLDIAEQYNYPVNSSHAGLNYDKLTHEYNLTLEEAIRIRNLGGVISLSMPRSIKGTTNFYISGNSWDKDTKTYVNKMYGYKEMVKFMRGDLHGGDWELEDKDFPAIASASDIGAFLDQIGPRFRRAPSEDESIYNENGKYYNLHREATLNEAVLNSDNGIFYVDTTPPLEYPFAAFDGSGNTFSEQVTGERIFDFNVDGLAHVGLFPDLFADVRNIVENNPDDYLVDDPDSPLSSADTYLDPIFNSAEAFVRMWEKIDAFVALPPTITPTITGIQGDNGWYTSDVTIVWNVESDFSVDSKTGCETVIIDYDTPSTTLTCQAENVGGVSEESVTIKRDTTSPTVSVTIPAAGGAVQDRVTLTSLASDVSGVSSLSFYIREPGNTTGIPIGQEDLAGLLASGTSGNGEWERSFDTTTLQDGYYVILAKALDTCGNEGWSEVVDFSIRNWAVVKLLPASGSNKAGRTMPVKFSLRIAAAVDPSMPFVYNEGLEIKVFKTSKRENILQTSHYGDSSKDYRINSDSELYITNFKTTKKPAEYTVDIWRTSKNWEIGSFTFETVK